MFSKSDFQAWGKESAVLFAAVATRITDREEDDLLRTYGFRGFPSMAILDAKGEALQKQFGRDLFSMKNAVTYAPIYSELKPKVDDGKKVDQAKWFLARLATNKLKAGEAKDEIGALQLSSTQKKDAEQLIFVGEMSQLAGRGRRRGGNANASEKVYTAFKAGKRLPAGSSPERFFDDQLVKAAMEKGDAEAFFFSFDRVRKNVVGMIGNYESRLKQIPGYRKRFEGNDAMLDRVNQMETQSKTMIKESKDRLVKLDATAKKLKAAKK